MAKVRCGLIMCCHNSKNTPRGFGTCKCTDKVHLKYDDRGNLNEGCIICKNFKWDYSKCRGGNDGFTDQTA
jgi:hypothetical protein